MNTEEIALVNMCYPKEAVFRSPPLGLLSIASFLNQFDVKSHIYDISVDIKCEEFTVEKITDYLCSIKEQIIGISIWDSVISKIVLSIQKLKQMTDKTIILGGPTATNLSILLMEKFPCIDYCVEGEGEKTMLNLLQWIKINDADLNGLSEKVIGRKANTVFRGTFENNYLDASDIPSINYDFCNIEQYNRFEISSTRGCPFKCDFCSINSTLDNKIRIRPLDKIFEELEILFTKTQCDIVNFVDDNFGLYHDRLIEFCNTFKGKFPNKKWACYFRLNDLTKVTVDLMVNSGCIGVFIGVETGNKDRLNKFGKNIDKQELLSRLKYATAKFEVTASFIWGFPDEDETQLLETFDVIEKIIENENILIDLYQLSPLSGTPLTSNMLNNLAFDENAISGFIFPPNMPKLSEEEKWLITENPTIFSAFYHENTECFGNKLYMVNKFLEKNTLNIKNTGGQYVKS
jgi:radical SAM superfamily enzyme YgiQ (UPF0313 family)